MDKWDKRFMDLTETIAKWSSCFKSDRSVGAVIVKNKRILTTGYNGAPAGIKAARKRANACARTLASLPGTRHELCYAIHAEQNAIIQAAKMGVCIEGATLYCTHQPCVICSKMIVNAGISRVVYAKPYPDEFAQEIFKEAGVKLVQFKS
jgi:dCMP deaminase